MKKENKIHIHIHYLPNSEKHKNKTKTHVFENCTHSGSWKQKERLEDFPLLFSRQFPKMTRLVYIYLKM